MTVVKQDSCSSNTSNPKFSSPVHQASLLLVYLSLAVTIYSFNCRNFSGVESHPVVDALNFCIITMCKIGYGDITPLTPPTKVFVFVLIGFRFINILLSGVVNYILDLQESMILKARLNYIVDLDKRRMRIKLKVSLALGVLILCIVIGGSGFVFC